MLEIGKDTQCCDTTAFNMIANAVDAINDTDVLAVRAIRTEEQCAEVAELFRQRSCGGIMRNRVGAVDGITTRIKKPPSTDSVSTSRFYSGHKETVGVNIQVSNLRMHHQSTFPFLRGFAC